MKNKMYVTILSIMNVIRSFVLVFTAYASKLFIDSYDFENKILNEDWVLYCALFISLIVVGIILHFVYLMLRTRFSVKVETNLRQEVFNAILKKNVNSLKEYHSGEVTNIYLNDVNHVRNGVCFFIPDVVLNVSKFLFALVFLIILDWKLLILLIVLGVVCLIGALIYSKFAKKFQRQAMESDGKLNAFMQESYQNLKYIQAMDSTKNVSIKSGELAKHNQSIKNKRNAVLVIGSTGLYFLVRASYVLAIVYGGLSVFNGTILYGDLTALIQVVSYFEAPLSMVSSLLNQYHEYRVSEERIQELLNIEDDVEQLQIDSFDKIVFDNVSFAYVEGENILKDLSFEINNGETILIKGPSGRGKTTIFKLLLGFIKPTSGEIKIVKGDNEYPISQCRNLFSYVPQENILFSGSVKQNFDLFINEMKDEEILEAMKFANIDQEVNDIHSKLNERGEGLSIGQIQRVLLSIAIKKERPCLLLDEFTSSLDKNLEKEIVEKVNTLPNTKIIISHREIELENARTINL